MAVSARNQLKGVVQALVKGDVMAEVSVDVGNGNVIVSVITRQSAETLQLKPGDQVTAVIKATEVMVAKE
jgi:molybdopterin-binding protein